MIESIIPLSKVKVTKRCPECSNPWVGRGAIPQNGLVSRNGATLYTFIEKCNVCSWVREVENVKLGA